MADTSTSSLWRRRCTTPELGFARVHLQSHICPSSHVVHDRGLWVHSCVPCRCDLVPRSFSRFCSYRRSALREATHFLGSLPGDGGSVRSDVLDSAVLYHRVPSAGCCHISAKLSKP